MKLSHLPNSSLVLLCEVVLKLKPLAIEDDTCPEDKYLLYKIFATILIKDRGH